ncbi:MAG: NYN domain-containing protein [Microgenomates group bacterium]
MTSERVLVIIDGSNFFHKLIDLKFPQKGLMNFRYDLFIKDLVADKKLTEVRYHVGAVRTEVGNTKSFRLFKEQRKLTGNLNKQNIKVVFGYLLKNDGVYHEKGVDVNMSVDMLVGAYEETYDTLVLISSDTDLIPAIKKVKDLGKKVEYFGFSHKPSFALMRFASESKLWGVKELEKYLS